MVERAGSIRRMLNALQWSFWLLGLGLQGAVFLTLAHGPWREFPALFAYIAALAVTTSGEILTYTMLGKTSASFKNYYWSAELIRQTALFRRSGFARSACAPARQEGRLVWAGCFRALPCWSGSFDCHALFARLGKWMTAAVRNMSFATGVMNLLAWFAYAKAGARDTTRLMISGGLGLQMTGEAIGQAIRQMETSNEAMLGASIFIVITHFLCLFIWWRALAGSPKHA
jgi:hypothetical protein